MRVATAPKGQEVTLEGQTSHTRADRAQAARGRPPGRRGQVHGSRAEGTRRLRADLLPLAQSNGSLSPDEARRLRELESENRRLKKLVADKELELDVLKEISRGNF